MAITTADGLVAAAVQQLVVTKTGTATTAATQWHSLLDRGGNPGAASLTVGQTTNGVLVTSAAAGFPSIASFGGSASGYLYSVGYASTVQCRLALKDRLWHAGSFPLTALGTTSLSSQPSILGRVPNGTGVGVEIWLEVNTAVSATATTVAVTYTNEAGVSGRNGGSSWSLSGYGSGRLFQLGLAAGDCGVQKIDSVIVGGTAASAGSVNVILARPLCTEMRVPVAGSGGQLGPDLTGLPPIYDTTALWPIVAADSTSSGVPSIMATIKSG